MKLKKRIICLAAALCMLMALLPAAFADVTADDARFKDKTWDEVIEDFLTEHSIDPATVALGYKNTVTGEEHYLNGDTYLIAGSMYKVPLNMIYTERIHNGEMSMDDKIAGVQYSKLLEWTIVNSNNDMAKLLWQHIGRYRTYRELIAPYMGEDAETVDAKFYENNFFTARQMIYCLNLLQTESDRFPGLIDVMLKAEPNNYFKYHEQEYEVAHKYGYLVEGYKLYMNDCAIVYTDDPIVIVMFTDTLKKGYDALADYCSLMSDYAQYHTAQRRIEEAEEAERAAIAALNSPSPAPGQISGNNGNTVNGSSYPSSANSDNEGTSSVMNIFAAAGICLLVVCGAAAVMSCKGRRKINIPWALAAVLLAGAALFACFYGSVHGAVILKPTGDPQAVVTEFFDDVTAGNYTEAYQLMDGYTTLGLENVPESETGKLAYNALKSSYSYKLYGDCTVDGLTAKQQVVFQYLDLTAMSGDVQAKTEDKLNNIVQSRKHDEVYDENDHFLTSVTDEAYSAAVSDVLQRAENYYTTTAFEITIEYSSGAWKVIPSAEMLKALTGGTVD